MSLKHDIESHIALKRRLGRKYDKHERTLRTYLNFAAARGERYMRSDTILEWASNSASSASARVKLRMARNVAIALHAQDHRHEIPPRGAFGKEHKIRPLPHVLNRWQIRALMDAALLLPPAGSMTPWTWHYLFGLMAATGIRRCEAVHLLLQDVTSDGLIIRQTKFRKSRLVVLHPSVFRALSDYIAIRKRAGVQSDSLFVLSTGRPPSPDSATKVFKHLARECGLVDADTRSGPRLHDLRHSFAVHALENMDINITDPSRHMLALSTYLGHSSPLHTYWYLEATPTLLRKTAEITELAQMGRSAR